MNKLFVHNIWFRLLSPFFSGVLVYLLILLINDSILAIQEDFLSQELYVCIGLAFITQEFSRLSLILFSRFLLPKPLVLRVFLQIVFSVVLTIILVTLEVHLYFRYFLLYTPNFRELYIFNLIYSFITVLYVVLYLGHFFLNRKNTEKLAEEERAKMAVETDFKNYKKGINPDLLFESLERILVLMKEDTEAADNLVDHFSKVYRYILSKKGRELVRLDEELEALDSLMFLFNNLPYRKVHVESHNNENPLVVPTSLLTTIETIIRSTIASESKTLLVSIKDHEEHIAIQYEPEERLNTGFSLDSIAMLSASYAYYTNQAISLFEEGAFKRIIFPKLNYHESSNT